MKFYVIYDFDVPAGTSVRDFQPPFRSKHFSLTECHASEVFAPECSQDDQRTGKHRKYAGVLTRKQFDALVDRQGLFMEECETMGSITDIGWLPAVSFRSESYEGYSGAYVTPLIERKAACDERDWERVKKALSRVYN